MRDTDDITKDLDHLLMRVVSLETARNRLEAQLMAHGQMLEALEGALAALKKTLRDGETRNELR